MKDRIILLLIACGVISLAAAGRFLISNGILVTDLDGNNLSISNLSSITAASITNSGLLNASIVGTDAHGRLIVGSAGGGGSGIQTNSGTGYNNNLTNLTLSGNVLHTNGFFLSDAISAATMTNSGLLSSLVLGSDANGKIVPGNLINATNNDTVVSNALFTFAQQQTNNYDTIVDVNAKLTSATNNALSLATNNDVAVSNSIFLQLRSATNNTLALATNNDTVVSNALFTFAQQQTNNFATIPFAESLTNNFDTIVDVNAKLVSATNNALALATNNDTVVSNSVFNFAQQQTNNFDTIVDVNAKLVSATNNALTLATNNDIQITNTLYHLTQPGYTWTTKITTPASGITYASPTVFGNGMFVQIIGDSSTFAEVLYSTDGRNWATNFTMPSSNMVWKGITYGGNQFVAIQSNSATFASSSDGLHWTARNANAIDNWVSVAYGNGNYIACSAAASSSFTTSVNGQNWSPGALITSVVLRALTFGGQLWIAVGDSGKIYTSPGGASWAIQTSPNSSSWTGVIYGNGLYVAWASAGTTTANSLITSTDGTNWFAQTISFAAPDSISYGAGVFVGYKGGTGAMVSNDGTNWTSATGTISGKAYGNVFGNGLFSVSSGTETQTSGKPVTTLDVSGNIWQGGIIVRGDITNSTQSSKDALATDSNGKIIAATAIQMTHIVQPGVIVTNGGTQAITISNVLSVDAAHYFSGIASLSSITNTGLTSADSIATDSNGKEIQATAILMSHIAQPGLIVTNNYAAGNAALVISNKIGIDVTHSLVLSNATAGRLAMFGAENAVTNASASGAVPINADGTPTTFAQVQALAPGVIVTNGGITAINYSNNLSVDAAHFMSGPMSPSLLTNGASAGSRIQITDANKKVIDSSASGAVPIDADGSASTGAQVKTLIDGLSPGVNFSTFTNAITTQSANYNILSSDWLVLLTGAHTATLPTAVGIAGRVFVIKCTSSGTNAILTTSSQTIDGATKWTNTATLKFTTVISDGANWRVIGQN